MRKKIILREGQEFVPDARFSLDHRIEDRSEVVEVYRYAGKRTSGMWLSYALSERGRKLKSICLFGRGKELWSRFYSYLNHAKINCAGA
jgi:hypothetical protein